ncbi:replication-relaxation family protein [Glycomyces albidus]|uniref:Replication-relaxation n=1 Tax=Glycomyces albidus TaxID=2656774 RepID=A0A6L5G4R2_9ACTN|nr:replication-relaxation family protein [Glycomyces albidus]MQM24633.1 hypothetical protein [Glycomyces albidus]
MRLIDAFARHRIFTAAQIAALYFPSAWSARIRLVTLIEMEVLARFRDANRAAYRYTLGYWGAAVHAWRRGDPPPTKAAVALAAHQLAVSRKRCHLEGVNAFFTALHAEATALGSISVTQWLCEDEAASLFLGKVRPDGAAVLAFEDGRTVPFFFEYDTGTEPLTLLTAKLDRYTAAKPVGGARPVLLQITRPGREQNFHHELAGREYPFPVATTAGSGGTLGVRWRRLGSTTLVALADLGLGVRP